MWYRLLRFFVPDSKDLVYFNAATYDSNTSIYLKQILADFGKITCLIYFDWLDSRASVTNKDWLNKQRVEGMDK